MSTVNQTLSCTGTGSAKVIRSPSIKKTVVATSVPKLLKFPGRKLNAVAVSRPVISALHLGIDAYDIIQGQRKWFVSEVGKWELEVRRRFQFLVRGKPVG